MEFEHLQTAVLFLVFNRPGKTEIVFDTIRKARPPRLYVASDGPRANRINETAKVELVRKISTSVNWPCELFTLFRGHNLGCKQAVSSAISWFFEHEEQGIILEDDCVPCQSFYYFCESMLNRFADDNRVMSICGTNVHPDSTSVSGYCFSSYSLMWGWATWKSAWEKYDKDLHTWPLNKANDFLRNTLGFNRIQRAIWTDILNKTYSGIIDTWDYQWIYTCWVCGGLTVVPLSNLITNIGFEADATHTKLFQPVVGNLVCQEMTLTDNEAPPLVQPSEKMDYYISTLWFNCTAINYIKLLLLTRVPIVRTLKRLLRGSTA